MVLPKIRKNLSFPIAVCVALVFLLLFSGVLSVTVLHGVALLLCVTRTRFPLHIYRHHISGLILVSQLSFYALLLPFSKFIRVMLLSLFPCHDKTSNRISILRLEAFFFNVYFGRLCSRNAFYAVFLNSKLHIRQMKISLLQCRQRGYEMQNARTRL